MANYLGDMTVKWNHAKKDFTVAYPENEADGQLVVDHVLSSAFLEQLTERGFDLSTLQFTVRLQATKRGRPGPQPKLTAVRPAAHPGTRAPVPRITREGIIIPVERIPGQVQGRIPGIKG